MAKVSFAPNKPKVCHLIRKGKRSPIGHAHLASLPLFAKGSIVSRVHNARVRLTRSIPHPRKPKVCHLIGKGQRSPIGRAHLASLLPNRARLIVPYRSAYLGGLSLRPYLKGHPLSACALQVSYLIGKGRKSLNTPRAHRKSFSAACL